MEDIQVAIQITASDGVKICNIIDKDSEFRLNSFTGKINVSVSLTDIRLYPDIYFVSIWVGTRITSIPYDFKEDCLSFEIRNGGKLTSRELPRSAGLFFLNPNWNCYQK
jgi:lipopolysaccharide transport system ATP-binding protein